MESRVIRRYARALFELAREEKKLEQAETDLKKIRDMLDQAEEFRELLESPIIQAAEKRKVFEELLKDRVDSLTFHFLLLLLHKNREELLPGIIENFLKLLDESRGIVRGQLITAHEFSGDQLTRLKEQLDQYAGGDVRLEQQVDTDLLGGFIVRLGDTVIDNSIRNQLNRLRETMVSRE